MGARPGGFGGARRCKRALVARRVRASGTADTRPSIPASPRGRLGCSPAPAWEAPLSRPLPQRPTLGIGVLPIHLPAERRCPLPSECGASLASDRSGPQLPLPDHAPYPAPPRTTPPPVAATLRASPPPFFGRPATLDPAHFYELTNETSSPDRSAVHFPAAIG